MMQLALLRHGESEWNKLNLFTGWTDVELSETGVQEAKNAGQLLNKEGYAFDLSFTSYLKRAIHTLNNCLAEMDREWLPVVKAWQLNERHYGALQGLNKSETAAKYGEDQVKVWRRSFDVPPPPLAEDDERNARKQPAYRDVDPALVPLTESLAITIERAVPYYEQFILPEMKKGKRVLIAAHGNSLRSLVMMFDKLTPEEILEVNIPTAVPLSYTFDQDWNVVDKHYIGDPDVIAAKIDAVANQGKAKK